MVDVYEAQFKTKCHQCFRNLYRTSNIYISEVRYLYPTSDVPALALALAEVGYCISDVGYRHRSSDIDIGNIGVILSQAAPRRRKHVPAVLILMMHPVKLMMHPVKLL